MSYSGPVAKIPETVTALTDKDERALVELAYEVSLKAYAP